MLSFADLDPQSPQFAVQAVDRLLTAAAAAGASDLHLQPTAEGLEAAWRIDGVLHSAASLPRSAAATVVARLKVLADLLTYRTDIPQEGRLRSERRHAAASPAAPPAANAGPAGNELEMRVSTLPTLYGERAVVRLLPGTAERRRLADLGLPVEVRSKLESLLQETSGLVIVTGPAGSGKTTTLYACLRHLAASSGGRSLVSLEDPIEAAVPGVAQSQANLAAGFDLESGLRFLLRHDPEVVMVGEIRDRITAQLACQAALTGHLILTTFHAGSAAGAISRLSDLGVEPYLLRSGVLAILGQRLLRRLCACKQEATDPADRLGLAVSRAWNPGVCEQCRGTGYSGRFVLAELLVPERTDVGRAILSRSDADQLEALAVAAGMITRWQRACAAVEAGETSPAEVRRVLGAAGGTGG